MQANLRKIFVYILTNRRHYIILVSVYFLMQPGATEQMLGYSMSIGSIIGFVMEVPSGYFADRFGHKKTLILSKFAMLAATLCYAFADSVIFFYIASACIGLGFSLMSGTLQSFTHETLESLGKDDEYTSIMSKMKGKVSLIQVCTFALFPLLAEIDIRLPFMIGIGIDVIGLAVTYMLVQPEIHRDIKKPKTLRQVIKEQKSTDFFPIALFFSIIGSFLMGFTTFREPYMMSIGYVLATIGLVSAGSRLFWRAFSYGMGRVRSNISLNQLMIFETCFFAFYFVSVALFPNVYYVGIMLAMGLGYRHARGPLISQYIMENIPDPRYKSTVLSLKSQINSLLTIITPLAMGYLVSLDIYMGAYRDGIFIWGVLIFVLLGGVWFWWRRGREVA